MAEHPFELDGHNLYNQECEGIWATALLCDVISWDLPKICNEDLKSVLPEDVASLYAFSSSTTPQSTVRSFFYVNRIHPASAPWRVLEALLTKANATLRVNVVIAGPQRQRKAVTITPTQFKAILLSTGDVETRLRQVITENLLK